MIPKLQLAFDITDGKKAVSIAKETQDYVDIIEVGTVLAIEEGMQVVREMKQSISASSILADVRIIKAGGKIASCVYNAGADIVTVISDATNDTIEAVVEERDKRTNRDILMEINQSYTDKQLEYWLSLGIDKLIFHRSSEYHKEGEEWNEKDFTEINRLADMGFEVGVTGGIELPDIAKFSGVSVGSFIIGRSIASATEPREAAKEYRTEIDRVFGG